MKPSKIRALLVENNVTQTSIARDLRVSPSSINKVINGLFVSYRIRQAIADATRTPFEKMWRKAA